ncbi:hypothetical protein D3C79_739000 [compost metagenome]
MARGLPFTNTVEPDAILRRMVRLVMWGQWVPDPSGGDAIDENVRRTGRYGRRMKAFMVGSYVTDLGCMLRHNMTQVMLLRGMLILFKAYRDCPKMEKARIILTPGHSEQK